MCGEAQSREELARAIRRYCLQCSGESKKLVEGCHLNQCPLWPYRSRAALGGQAAGRRRTEAAGQISFTMLETTEGGAMA